MFSSFSEHTVMKKSKNIFYKHLPKTLSIIGVSLCETLGSPADLADSNFAEFKTINRPFWKHDAEKKFFNQKARRFSRTWLVLEKRRALPQSNALYLIKVYLPHQMYLLIVFVQLH